MRSLALALVTIPALATAAPLEPGAVAGPSEPIEGIDPMLLVDPTETAPGVGEPPTAYIVNGVNATEGEWPEVVYVEIEGLTGRESLCSGSLIHPEWVLTAGHCIDAGDPESCHAADASETPPGAADLPNVTIHFSNEFPASSERQIKAIHDDTRCHPEWLGEDDAGDNNYDGDVALIHLEKPVDFAPVMSLNPDPMDSSWIGSEITFIGFGIVNWQGGDSGTKRYTSVPIIRVPADAPHLVQVFNGENSTCQGDSGGPGVRFSPLGGYSQVTVTSHGIECGRGPSGHMRVDHFLPWIQEFVPEIITTPSAPPDFVCSHRLDEEDDGSRSFGTSPLELKCVVDFFAPDTVVDVTWRWGDGVEDVVTDSLDGTHTYTKGGRYSVEACTRYTASSDSAAEPIEHCVSRTDMVQVCATPEVSFQVSKDEGLTYQFLNTTDLDSSFGCINDLEWSFYEGDEVAGEPFSTLRSWEPQVTFDRPGTYTAVLNVGGIGGTGAAKVTFRATRAGGAGACSHVGGGGLGLLAIGLGLLGFRRRR